MRYRLFVVAAIVASALVAIPVVISQAAKRKNYDVDVTALVATVKPASAPGKTSIAAGYVTGDPYGKGAVTLKTKSTTNPDNTATLAGKFTLFNKRGSVSGPAEGKVTPTTGGNATFEGTGEITSGTGKYKGAKGDFDVTGTYDSGTGVLTLHGTGKVKY
jgi:hypothetical protein